jgi:predicted nuclease with TOPRIM domain
LVLQESVEETEALLKRHEELEARLLAQDERAAACTARARVLQQDKHHAADRYANY